MDIFITETYRSQARQDYLYAQGRTRPGQIVTWTRHSSHTSRLAWDIAVAPPKPLYDVATLNQVGAIARRLGITWGGDWETVDRPHFEVTTNWKMPAGYRIEGEVLIPTSSKERVGLIIKREDDEKLQLSDWQWDMLYEAIPKLNLDSPGMWLDKIEKRELTTSELAWLNTIVLSRQSNQNTPPV